MRHTKPRGVLGFWHFFLPPLLPSLRHRLWLFGCNKDFQLKRKFFFFDNDEEKKVYRKEISLHEALNQMVPNEKREIFPEFADFNFLIFFCLLFLPP